MTINNHVVFLSGGLGSWATLRRVINRHGADNVYALFTDTLIEDKTLYKFLLDTLTLEFGADAPESYRILSDLPDTSYETQEERKKQLNKLAKTAERDTALILAQ